MYVPPKSDLFGQPVYLYGSTMLRPLRLAYGLAPVIEVLQAHGHRIEPLLKAADIPRFAIEEPSFRIAFAQELRFIELALEKLRLPTAGLIVGQRYHLALFGVVGLCASCAPTMRDLFRAVPDHPALTWGSIELAVWRDGDEEYVAFTENEEVRACARFFVERDIAATLALFRQTLGAELRPTSVLFAHPAPPDAAPYEEFFDCRLRFSAGVNQIRFAREVWDAEPPQANEMSYRFYANQCRRLSDAMAEPLSYADVVRSRLRSLTPIPGLEEVVQSLSLTRRTLQRRLEAEGTQFSSLLAEVRLLRAIELMRLKEVRDEEIATRLGFSDASAFSRAFKNWTGHSPRAYRSSRLY